MSEIEEMIQPQENDSSNPDELDVINVEETPISNGKRLQQMAETVSYYQKRAEAPRGLKIVSSALTGIFAAIMTVSYLMGKDIAAAESLIGTIVSGLFAVYGYLDYKGADAEFKSAQRNYEKLIRKIENEKDSDQKGRVK